jgi:hypothetical protein
MPDSVQTAIGRALEALDALQLLGEDIEDEWTYVTELGDAWRDRFDAVTEARADEPLEDSRTRAIDLAIHETTLITDPHRAIDWLSTFPQIVLVALGERP